MKWLSAGLTFVNVTTVGGLLGGIAGHGLSKRVALCAAIAGLVAALLAVVNLGLGLVGAYLLNAPVTEEEL